MNKKAIETLKDKLKLVIDKGYVTNSFDNYVLNFTNELNDYKINYIFTP